MSRIFRLAVMLIIIPLPGFLKIPIAKILLGWKVGKNCSVGWSWIDSPVVEIGDDTRIGHFNVIRNCSAVIFGNSVTVLNWNQIFGSTFRSEQWTNRFSISEKSYVTSNHFFDVGGGVTIGNEVVIGGRDTQVWSHSIKMQEGKRILVPVAVHVGSMSYIGARVTVICCDLPGNCLVGAGAVVVKSFPDNGEIQVIAGNPATVRKTYP